MYIQKYTQCILYIQFAMYICYLHICVCDTQRLMDFSPAQKKDKLSPIGSHQDPGGMMWEMNDMLTKSTWATKRLKRR